MTDAQRERFTRTFLMNVDRRSRSAKGKDEGSKTSSKKLPLLLQGESLKAKVAENVAILIDDVWNDAAAARGDRARKIRPVEIGLRCERWYDIACAGFIDETGYEPLFRALEADCVKLGLGDELLPVNRRYRTWTPGYTLLQIPPALIDRELVAMLYAPLGLHLERVAPGDVSLDARSLSRLLSHADVMMDGEIHPWIDGCSRVSTALVMWLAALYGPMLPLFAPTREEHYRTLLDVEAHARYFKECLARAETEIP